jgi:hypothetical protein
LKPRQNQKHTLCLASVDNLQDLAVQLRVQSFDLIERFDRRLFVKAAIFLHLQRTKNSVDFGKTLAHHVQLLVEAGKNASGLVTGRGKLVRN